MEQLLSRQPITGVPFSSRPGTGHRHPIRYPPLRFTSSAHTRAVGTDAAARAHETRPSETRQCQCKGCVGSQACFAPCPTQGMVSSFGSTCHGAGRCKSRNRSRNNISHEDVLQVAARPPCRRSRDGPRGCGRLSMTTTRPTGAGGLAAQERGGTGGGGRPLLKGRGGGYPRVTQPLASCLCLPPNHLQPPLQPPVTAPNRFVSHLQPPL